MERREFVASQMLSADGVLDQFLCRDPGQCRPVPALIAERPCEKLER